MCAVIFMAGILTGRISGAHFNGAVTLTIYLIEGKWKENLPIAGVTALADFIGVSFMI